jgi:hypothetical protein
VTPDPPSPLPDEPLAEVGREPLREAIATARHDRRGGISVGTLAVAAAASAAASYTASHLWGSGTVLSAALTPVIVALVSEFLRRPVDRVASTAQRVAPIVPRTPSGPPGPSERPPPEPTRAADAPVGQGDWATVSYEAPPSPGWRPRWRLVLGTGLLAFIIVVAFYTVPDLLVGHSITGAGGSTTFFSGGAQNTPLVTTPTVSTPTTTQTVTVPTTTVTTPATVTVTTAAPPGSPPPATTTATTTTATTPQTTSTGAAPPAVP